jgi:hypothetical protein
MTTIRVFWDVTPWRVVPGVSKHRNAFACGFNVLGNTAVKSSYLKNFITIFVVADISSSGSTTTAAVIRSARVFLERLKIQLVKKFHAIRYKTRKSPS